MLAGVTGVIVWQCSDSIGWGTRYYLWCPSDRLRFDSCHCFSDGECIGDWMLQYYPQICLCHWDAPCLSQGGEVLSYEENGIWLVTPFTICDFCILVGMVTTPFTLLKLGSQYPLGQCSEGLWNAPLAFLFIMTLLIALQINAGRSTQILQSSLSYQEEKW